MTTTAATEPELTWVLCTCTQSEPKHYNFDDNVLITFSDIDTWPVEEPFPNFSKIMIRNCIFKIAKRKRRRRKGKTRKRNN